MGLRGFYSQVFFSGLSGAILGSFIIIGALVAWSITVLLIGCLLGFMVSLFDGAGSSHDTSDDVDTAVRLRHSSFLLFRQVPIPMCNPGHSEGTEARSSPLSLVASATAGMIFGILKDSPGHKFHLKHGGTLFGCPFNGILFNLVYQKGYPYVAKYAYSGAFPASGDEGSQHRACKLG